MVASSQSKNIHCPNCSCIQLTDGKTTHFRSAITPVIVSRIHAQVVALRPEFLVPQDGHPKPPLSLFAYGSRHPPMRFSKYSAAGAPHADTFLPSPG